jgi:predicted dehydrogenase
LIGLLTIQMLLAQGCRVLAIDFDAAKLELAQGFGAEICNPSLGEDPVAVGIAFSRQGGVDGVIITASTKASDPVIQAARMCRQRGRIILVGVTGLELNRADFYDKELSFQVSCSYGPGRYDSAYEEGGQDYPLGFVRWTEQRNFEAVLDLMVAGKIDVSKLITHRFAFVDAPKAYELLSNDRTALGILLEYSHSVAERHIMTVGFKPSVARSSDGCGARIGFIGAGNYASRMLIPAFRKAGASMAQIASAGGTNAVVHGRAGDFAAATTDISAMISDPNIDAITIVTRHNSHARFVCEALNAGKHVFVEKPLALTLDELAQVEAVYSGSDRQLMVGFNRRFSPLTQKMKALSDGVRDPKSLVMVMNAGAIPANHWTQDIDIGGGRIIGEACHHIDLARFLIGASIVSVQARRISQVGEPSHIEDRAAILLGFADGSLATIHYLSNGGPSFAKERIEMFASGRTLQLDNFLGLYGYNWPGFSRMKLWRQDKGQNECAKAFVGALQAGGTAPIAAEELFEVSRITIEVAAQLRAQG